jgi:S1-C subfamily serine protease
MKRITSFAAIALLFAPLLEAQTPQTPTSVPPQSDASAVTKPPQSGDSSTASSQATSMHDGWADIVAHVRPAVVVIETDKGFGSGFVVKPDGTIVTNHHVVADAKAMAVKFASGEVYRNVYLLSSDPTEDLAVLKIEAVELPTVPLGNSSNVQVGEDVLLVGAPRGMEQTVSNGLISAIRIDKGVRVIQTSAAASPGSSGGPLLNRHGEAIGVMSFGVTKAENLNFTIPINYVRGKLDTLTLASKPQPFESLKSDTGQAERHRGVWIYGYGYPAGSFQYIYMDLMDFLGAHGVEVANRHPQKFAPTDETGYLPLSTVLEAVSKAGADSLLYVKVEPALQNGNNVKIYMQCFDSTGRLLWEEKASSLSSWGGGMRGGIGQMEKKLASHVGKPGLMLKQALAEASAPKK